MPEREETGGGRVRVSLSLQAFRESPVWCFADDMQHHVPCEVDDHLPEVGETLFVACDLTTAAGRRLPGYIVEPESVYAIAVLTEDREYVFNLGLPSWFPETEAAIRDAYDLPKDEPILPLDYVCRYGFPGEPPIAGRFDPFS